MTSCSTFRRRNYLLVSQHGIYGGYLNQDVVFHEKTFSFLFSFYYYFQNVMHQFAYNYFYLGDLCPAYSSEVCQTMAGRDSTNIVIGKVIQQSICSMHIPINYLDNPVLKELQIRNAGSELYYSIMHGAAFSITDTFLIKFGE